MSETHAILHRLRTETRDLHDAIEAVPFHCRLASGSLSLSEYATLLEVLLQIHGALDELRVSSPSGILTRVSSAFLDLRPSLLDDLEDVLPLLPNCAQDSRAAAVLTAAHDYTVQLRRTFRQRPLALLGHLYVHHGSLLGGLHLRPLVLAATALPPEKVRYFGGLGPAVPGAWRAFREAVGREEIGAGDGDLLVASARHAFALTHDIYLAFDPPAAVTPTLQLEAS